MQNPQRPWCPRLECWLQEAYRDAGRPGDAVNDTRDFAILPERLFELVGSLSHAKKYDFCFIGSFAIRPAVAEARRWILPFLGRAFGPQSFLQFTDSVTRRDHKSFGPYDRTKSHIGFVPREEPVAERGHLDKNYYQVMCQSRFTLCPAGDSPWSMRFYEALVCRTIPIVNSVSEAARTTREAQLGYKFLTTNSEFVFREDWVEHNYAIARNSHALLG